MAEDAQNIVVPAAEGDQNALDGTASKAQDMSEPGWLDNWRDEEQPSVADALRQQPRDFLFANLPDPFAPAAPVATAEEPESELFEAQPLDMVEALLTHEIHAKHGRLPDRVLRAAVAELAANGERLNVRTAGEVRALADRIGRAARALRDDVAGELAAAPRRRIVAQAGVGRGSGMPRVGKPAEPKRPENWCAAIKKAQRNAGLY